MKPNILLILVALVACGRSPKSGQQDSAALASALPPGHVPIPATPAGTVITPMAKALLDSGNAAFRVNKYVEALAYYRRAGAEVPGHAAPWFGTYMAARALNDTVLADSALRMVRERAPGMEGHPSGTPGDAPPASPHGATIPKASGTS